jgi:hypothetical protein
VWPRARRTAFSIASVPPFVKNTMSRSPGASSAISRAAFAAHVVRMERRDRAQTAGLLLDRRDQLRMLVADVHVHELAREVEPRVSLVVPHARALRAGDDAGASAPWADQEWKTCARSFSYAVDR